MCEITLGFTPEELLSRPFVEFVHPEDRIFLVSQLHQLLSHTETICFETRCLCQDGSYKWLSWNAASLPESNLIYAAGRDITARKQAEEKLRRSEERFRLLVESVEDYAIYLLDPTGIVVSWNSGAERIKGYKAEEIVGHHFSCFYTPEDIQQDKPDLELRLAVQQGRCETEGQRTRKDGSTFWVNAIVTPLWDKQGQLRGFAKVTRDITERKQAVEALRQAYSDLEKRVEERTAALSATNAQLTQEIAERQQVEAALRRSEAQLKQQTEQLQQTLQELKETQAQLVHSEKMSSLGQLVAGVAHEINNPVSFIYGNLKYADQYTKTLLHLIKLYQQHHPQPVPAIQAEIEAADLEFVATDLVRLLHSVKVGAERIREIVLSLRNFSRLDECGAKPSDIHDGLDSTLMILQNRLKANPEPGGITVIKNYGELPLVECYAGQLNQVFMNILINAIDALESFCVIEQSETQPQDLLLTKRSLSFRPTICIHTEMNNHHAVIRIADNGPGMSAQVQKNLFDPFFTTKPVGKGTGLGLSISYQIVVEKHKGQLKCISQPGEGTEFMIAIPLQSQPTITNSR